MPPFVDPRKTRAWAALGALGVAWSLTGAHLAPAAQDHTPLIADVQVRWLDAGSPAVRLLFAQSRRQSTTARTIALMIRAGDRIARLPYIYGGGHGSFDAAGYDCSGSVSFVLHAGGLLAIPADSSGLESFGLPGPGRHVTVYANAGHAFMTIDGRRFDTIAFQETGTRWSSTLGSTDGYVVRHPAGL